MSKPWYIKVNGVSYNLAFATTDGTVQNSLKKLEITNESRQDWHILITVFAYFLSASFKILFLQGTLDTRSLHDVVLKFP